MAKQAEIKSKGKAKNTRYYQNKVLIAYMFSTAQYIEVNYLIINDRPIDSSRFSIHLGVSVVHVQGCVLGISLLLTIAKLICEV